MHRRQFLAAGAAAAGLAVLGPRLAHAMSTGKLAVPARLGVQLYTLRDVFPGDFNGTLEAIKRIGYDEVEFAGYHDRDPKAIRAVLDDVGLAAPAAHVGLDALRDDFDGAMEAANVIGHAYVVVPWMGEDLRPTDLDGYRRLGDELNAMGARARDAGVRMAYHNHDFEFETFGGETPGYDALLEATDPALVAMELDLYWAAEAGHDPLDYFARYPGRFPLWHVKDRTADGAMVSVGQGALDFAAFFARAEEAGLEHAFVEHDHPGDARDASLDSVEASYRHLQGLR